MSTLFDINCLGKTEQNRVLKYFKCSSIPSKKIQLKGSSDLYIVDKVQGQAQSVVAVVETKALKKKNLL
jgi:hypothetical protein